jgi:TM2 domain-containing membrane protein YozV
VTHEDFVAEYKAGRLRVKVQRDAAARFIAGRALLPLVLLPFLGLGVALALLGYIVTGTIVFLATLLLRLLVRRSSDGFIVWRALQDAEFYRQAMAAQVLSVEECSTPSRSS